MDNLLLFTILEDAEDYLDRMFGWPRAVIEQIDKDCWVICANPQYGTDDEILGGPYVREDGHVR
jgi:hypothetical protein